MTATDAQVGVIMRERSRGKTQQQAAVKANLRSRKTVAKYEQAGVLPSGLKQPRTYRTRPRSLRRRLGDDRSEASGCAGTGGQGAV